MTPTEKRRRFAELHARDQVFALSNPWDLGSARVLAHAGAEALATTSSGLAWSMGTNDYGLSREILIEHVAALGEAVDLPLTVDSERCFADDLEGVAATVRLLHQAGAAGCSIEDWNGESGEIDDLAESVARVEAAAEAAHADPDDAMVLTARCENLIRGVDDFDGTIDRLVRYRDAGADCVYAPGLSTLEQVRTVVDAVGIPVNVLGVRLDATIEEIGGAGARRVSVGGALASLAYGRLARAARELLDDGTMTFAGEGLRAEDRQAFT